MESDPIALPIVLQFGRSCRVPQGAVNGKYDRIEIGRNFLPGSEIPGDIRHGMPVTGVTSRLLSRLN